MDDRENALNFRENTLYKKQDALDEREDRLYERGNNLDDREDMLHEKEESLDDREKALDNREKIIDDKEYILNDRELSLYDKENTLNERENALNDMENVLDDRENPLSDKENTLLDREEIIDVGENALEEMTPLVRVPSHSANPIPKPNLESPAGSAVTKTREYWRSFRTIPAGHPGSGASHRQSRLNRRPHEVLVSSPIPDQGESAAATPRANSADIDALSLSTTNVHDDAEVSPTSSSALQAGSYESRRSSSLYYGYYILNTTPDKGKSRESSYTGSMCTPTTEKAKSRESSYTTPSHTGPATPTSDGLGEKGRPVPVSTWSSSSEEEPIPRKEPHSSERLDKTASEIHPLELFRHVGTEIIGSEPGQSPIDALFCLKDEGCVRSERAGSTLEVDSALMDFERGSYISVMAGEPADASRSPVIMPMTDAVARRFSGMRIGSETRSRSLSRPEEWRESQENYRLPTAKLRQLSLPEAKAYLAHRQSIPLPRLDGPARRRGNYQESQMPRTRQSSPLNCHEEHKPSTGPQPKQPGSEPIWASRLNVWPFMGSDEEEQATFKEPAEKNARLDVEDSLCKIIKVLTENTSYLTADLCADTPSGRLMSTADQITSARFRDRCESAVVAIHKFMRVTQESESLAAVGRRELVYEWTMRTEWESASTRALLAVLATEISCNAYMNAVIQGELERLPFSKGLITGDKQKGLRRCARTAYDITRKVRDLFCELDKPLGEAHEEKYEEATRALDAAIEVGLIEPTWWSEESKENIVQLEDILSSIM